MNIFPLEVSRRNRQLLREELLRRWPELAEDDRALNDSLDGISDLDTQIATVVRSIDEDRMLIFGIEARLEELTARAQRLEHRAEAKEKAILHAMTEAGMKKIELPDGTISVRQNPPSLVVTDEAAVPDLYYIYPPAPEPRLDKRTILADLKIGEVIPGCELSNGSVGLQIRKK